MFFEQEILENDSEILASYEFNQVRNFIFDEINKIDVTSDTSVTYEISKRLKHVKEPIELFKR